MHETHSERNNFNIHFLNAVLILLFQLQSMFTNTCEGDLQIAGSYSSTSVIPRLYDRGYGHYLGLHFWDK